MLVVLHVQQIDRSEQRDESDRHIGHRLEGEVGTEDLELQQRTCIQIAVCTCTVIRVRYDMHHRHNCSSTDDRSTCATLCIRPTRS